MAAAGFAVLSVIGGEAAWLALAPSGAFAQESGHPTPLPVPPVPPRVATGADYDTCLGMLGNDPQGASAFAEAWEATGGGGGATHCLGLARIALGDPEAGADILEKLAGASHAPAAARAAVYGQAGQAWLMAGDAAHALAAVTLALALNPDEPDLLIERAVAAADLDRFKDAAEDLTHALARDPARADALTWRAAARRHLGQVDLARDDIDRALALDPDSAEALLERGILRQLQGDHGGARADWERAATLAPDSATADLAEQNLALLAAGPERR